MDSDLVREFIRNRDVLMGFIHALSGDHEAAEEIFQELAVSIVTEVQRGEQPERFLAWARSMARNRTMDYYRRQSRLRRVRCLEDLADVVDQSFAEHEIPSEESVLRLRFLRECLGGLGAKARQIVELRYHGKRSMREIAADVSWKEAAVKVALSKARRALAACVKGKLAGTGE